MKKLFIAACLGVFVLGTTNLNAQNTKVETNVAVETTFSPAINAINNNKKLSAEEKQKFIARLEIIAKGNKANHAKEYNRIAENYLRVTGSKLPALTDSKE